MLIEGYFTTERNIIGLTPREMEIKLGFPPGRLIQGARILLLDRAPHTGEFEPRGSTLFPAGDGLDKTALHKSKFTPGAWLGERLVKVKPLIDSGHQSFPSSSNPVEQWDLISPVPGREICVLAPDQPYWGR